MKKTMMFLMALSLVFVFGATCYADSYETEPNNDEAQANALVSGVPMIGQCPSHKDDDWFYICTSGADVIATTFGIEGVSRSTWSISIEDVHGNQLSEYEHRELRNHPLNPHSILLSLPPESIMSK